MDGRGTRYTEVKASINSLVARERSAWSCMIRVAIADDHSELRLALRLLLGLYSDIQIVCEASDGPGAIECARDVRPDVLVMDVQMPGLDGFEATKQIVDLGIPTQVVLISIFRGSYVAKKADESGARGFIPKDDLAPSLRQAIEAAYRGEKFFVE